MRTTGIIFFGAGIAMLAIAFVVGGLAISFRVNGEKATGTVSEVELRHYADGNSYCPVIRFNARHGGTYTHYSDVCSWPPSFEVGQKVTIYYDPADPTRSQLDDLMGVWFIPALMSFMGLIFGGVGFFLLFPNVITNLTKRT